MAKSLIAEADVATALSSQLQREMNRLGESNLSDEEVRSLERELEGWLCLFAAGTPK